MLVYTDTDLLKTVTFFQTFNFFLFAIAALTVPAKTSQSILKICPLVLVLRREVQTYGFALTC